MAAHSSGSKQEILGVTHDPVLRPIGALMAVVGAIWLLFTRMAVEAGTLTQPMLALLLVAVGVLVASIGRPQLQL